MVDKNHVELEENCSLDNYEDLPKSYELIEPCISSAYINQIIIAGFLSEYSVEKRFVYDDKGNRIKDCYSFYADKNQLAEKYSFYKTMNLITEKLKDYLCFIGIPKEVVEERQKNKGYGLEVWTYPEYKERIPDPIPLDWLYISKYAVEQKEYYIRDIENKALPMDLEFEIEGVDL